MKTPKIKRLEIEWKHFAVGNATCERCGNTGDALREAVEELRREFAPAGVKINLTETLLDKTRMAESNEIRMNSMLIGSWCDLYRLSLLRHARGKEHMLPGNRDR
jgi:hypothetical protein